MERDEKKSSASRSQPSVCRTRQRQEGDKEQEIASKHLPECFAIHVFLRDSTVSERLIPHRVQGVANCLGFQFISLCIKAERREKNNNTRTQSFIFTERQTASDPCTGKQFWLARRLYCLSANSLLSTCTLMNSSYKAVNKILTGQNKI